MRRWRSIQRQWLRAYAPRSVTLLYEPKKEPQYDQISLTLGRGTMVDCVLYHGASTTHHFRLKHVCLRVSSCYKRNAHTRIGNALSHYISVAAKQNIIDWMIFWNLFS